MKSAHSPALQRMSSTSQRARPTPASGRGAEGKAVTRQRVSAAVGWPKSAASSWRRQRRTATPSTPESSAQSWRRREAVMESRATSPDHGPEPAAAQALLERGQHALLVAGVNDDEPVRPKTDLRQRRGEEVRPSNAPEHLAAGPRRDAGGEHGRGRAMHRTVTRRRPPRAGPPAPGRRWASVGRRRPPPNGSTPCVTRPPAWMRSISARRVSTGRLGREAGMVSRAREEETCSLSVPSLETESSGVRLARRNGGAERYPRRGSKQRGARRSWGAGLALHPELRGTIHLDQLGGKASRLEREHVVEASVQPLLMLVGVQDHRHAVVHRLDGGVAVGHGAGKDRAPLLALPPQAPPRRTAAGP